MLCRKEHQKVKHLRRGPVFSCYFGAPQPLPSIPKTGFQQFHTSSRPRRYCKKTQPPDSGKDFPKERLRHSHFHQPVHRILSFRKIGINDFDRIFHGRPWAHFPPCVAIPSGGIITLVGGNQNSYQYQSK